MTDLRNEIRDALTDSFPKIERHDSDVAWLVSIGAWLEILPERIEGAFMAGMVQHKEQFLKALRGEDDGK